MNTLLAVVFSWGAVYVIFGLVVLEVLFGALIGD